MSYSQACTHMLNTIDIPIKEILNIVHKPCCQDCDYAGPNSWICLHHDCLHIGCSDEYNDHNTLHYFGNPSHCIHMNLSTHRFWCYVCKKEVFLMDQKHHQQISKVDYEGKPKDSSHSSYCDSHTVALAPDIVTENECNTDNSNGNDAFLSFALPRAIGMSGDTSESSDTEDGSITIPSCRPSGLVGLQNIGNTCYLNAALQALSNTVPLTRFFLSCPATVSLVSEGRKPGLSRTYQMLVTEMWHKKKGGYVVPSGILYGIRNVHAMFRGYHQHDTQEFLRNFMDQLHEELKQPWTPDPTSTDLESYSRAIDEPTASHESSEGEYETCDSGVSERSSLSDDLERLPSSSSSSNGIGATTATSSSKRRLSRSASPSRRLKTRFQNSVIENQPTTMSMSLTSGGTSLSSSTTAGNKSKQVGYKSIISDIFDGKLLSTVQCLTCNRVSSRVETFQDLSLPIPSRDHLAVIHGRNTAAAAAASTCARSSDSGRATAPVGSTCTEVVLPVDNGWISWILVWLKSWFYGPTITLHDCLAAFFSTDELKGDNMYSCERCNKLRNGIKYSKVLQLPEVLCVHLKRFRHELMFSSKISSAVSFPMKGLDMRPYLHSDCVSHVTDYELFSVICHHGTAGGGHYTCYALNSGQWYEFDDQCVTRVSPETVQNCEAYVLFYRKVIIDNCIIRNKVTEMSQNAASAAQGDEIFYISRQWVSRFQTCAEPGPIDNRDFLCQHGYVAPERVKTLDQLAITIPKSVYSYLYKKFGGNGPTPAVTCAYCQAHQRRLDLELETLMQLNLSSQKQQLPATHLLSKSWYASWLNYVQRKTLDEPGPIENGKSATYASQLGDEYVEICEEIWNFFRSIYGGGPEWRLDIKPLTDSDSNCENSDGNTSEAPLLTPVEDSVLTSESKTMETLGCHGEPMDVDPRHMITTAESSSHCAEVRDVCQCDAEENSDPATTETFVNGDDLSSTRNCNLSNGTSNTSFTDEEAQGPEKNCSDLVSDSTANMRRFHRRRKRDVCK